MQSTKHIELLGLKAEDKITGVKGVITTVSFDLFGCIQVILSARVRKDGTCPDSSWLDVSRLKLLSKGRVMATPDFDKGHIAEGKKGSANKPIP